MPPSLNKEYEDTYREMLTCCALNQRSHPNNLDCELAGLWPIVGTEYQSGKGTLFVGRATNGWRNKWTLRDILNSPEKASTFLKQIKTPIEPDAQKTMAWVLEKGEGRKSPWGNASAFLRVTRDIARALGPDESDEENPLEAIAWSQLMKIAPEASGNPKQPLCDAQFYHCTKLLALEVAQLQPKRIVVIAGYDWFSDFAKTLQLEMCQPAPGSDVVEMTARQGEKLWVVTKRPERKKETPFVHEVVDALKSLGSDGPQTIPHSL